MRDSSNHLDGYSYPLRCFSGPYGGSSDHLYGSSDDLDGCSYPLRGSSGPLGCCSDLFDLELFKG